MSVDNVKTLEVALGDFKLSRYPKNSPKTLQAWDSADRQLIEAAKAFLDQLEKENPVVWVINDNFGAITTALHEYQPWLITDSSIAHSACRLNHELNELTFDETRFLTSLEWPETTPDLVLFKIPKTLAYWEYQLTALKPRLSNDTHILGAAMAKHLPKSMVELINRTIGLAQPSLAVKKARLIECQFDSGLMPKQPSLLSNYEAKEFGLTLNNHPNLFSRDHLDIGTRFLLEKLPPRFELLSNQDSRIIDMACGNGAIGIWIGQRNPNTKITFVDESFMAVASAKLNAEKQLSQLETEFCATNCLEGIASNSADVIINNPPFHQQHVVGDFIARNMFKDAHRVLKNSGELWVVANRQLGYHIVLKRLFGNCETVTGNPKFVILKATKHS